MNADKIKEEIKGLSFEEIIDIADYINQTLKNLWQNDLSISKEEKAILDTRLEQSYKNTSLRYNLAELSNGIEAIKHQKKIEGELSLALSENEKKELDRRLLLIEREETNTIPFKEAFSNLKTWANTK